MRKIILTLGVASLLFIVCACKDDEASDMITTTVSGTITDPEGKPMFEAQVWDSTTPDKKVKTKKDGTYSLLVSHQGSFKLHISKKGYRERQLSVKVNAKQHKADLQLDYSYIKALSGTVKNPAGNPIADVVISVSTTDKKFKTGPRGNYSIKIPHSGKFDITLTKTGYKDKTVTVSLETDASAKNITMDYGYTTAVSGKVTFRNALVLMGAEISTSMAPAKKSVTNSDGTYRLTVAHAGNFTLTASKTGYITRTIKIETAEPQETQDIKLEKPSTGKTKVVAYYDPDYDFIGQKFDKLYKIDWTKLSHVYISSIKMDKNGSWYPNHGRSTRAIMESQQAHIINTIRAKNPNIKILAGFGSNKEEVYGDWIEERNGKTRAKFIANLITFLERYNYDGVEIDLEQKAITPSWENLILELKQAFQRKNLLVTGSLIFFKPGGWGNNVTNKGVQAFDMVNIMAYDGKGNWNVNDPGHHSSLAMSKQGFNLYRGMGVPANRLAISIVTYGYWWGGGKAGIFVYPQVLRWDVANANRNQVTRNGRTYYYNGLPLVDQKVKFAKDNGCNIFLYRLSTDAFDYTDAQGKKHHLRQYSQLNRIAKNMKKYGMTLAD